MLKKSLVVVLVASIIIMLTSCSSPKSNNKSSDSSSINTEIYNQTLAFANQIIKAHNNTENPSNELKNKIISFSKKYKTKANSGNSELISNLVVLTNSAFVFDGVNQDKNMVPAFNSALNNLKKIYGKKLKSTENLISANQGSDTATVSTDSGTNSPSELQSYMSQEGLSLTAKDVQYDMENNLDKNFALVGTANICDYYNYGYTDQKDFFCAEVTPDNGSYTDMWYVYFSRSDFQDLYNLLKNNNNIPLKVTAEISSMFYESGQGNMADAVQASW